MEIFSNTDIWIAFFTLCALEIVLGIDNIIFISILTNKLPANEQKSARQTGILLAVLMRIGLLFSISWVMKLTAPLFTIYHQEISGRDLILILGGLFLLYKSVKEIHHKVENSGIPEASTSNKATYSAIIGQIIMLDLIFSLDSVITAVGLVDRIEVMIAAVLVSVAVMLWSADSISRFVNSHPAVKVLALAFLIMIGTALIAEGLEMHFPKGYIYFAMAFAFAVELINIRIGVRSSPKK